MIDGEIIDSVIKYWLGCIRHEESIAVRPVALKSAGISKRNINITYPLDLREYFKLNIDQLVSILSDNDARLKYPMNNEVNEFFESWLKFQYQKYRTESDEMTIMIAAPAIYLPSHKLTGIFKFKVNLHFEYADEKPFRVPSVRKLKKGIIPPPPDFAVISRVIGDENFTLDTEVLEKQLGMTTSEIDALFEKCLNETLLTDEPEKFFHELSCALEGTTREGRTDNEFTDIKKSIQNITSIAKQRTSALSPKSKVHNVAIIYNATRINSTIHLQKELKKLDPYSVNQNYPLLYAYILKKNSPAEFRESLGLYDGLSTTKSQQEAINRFLGSSFTALQGPPGTGKTTLIKNIAAHTVVEQITLYAKTGEMAPHMLIVTSTNNRAVDTAILPIFESINNNIHGPALRGGNRAVCRTRLIEQLNSALIWIKRHEASFEPDAINENLKQAVREFNKLFTTFEKAAESIKKRERKLKLKESGIVRNNIIKSREHLDELKHGLFNLSMNIRTLYTLARAAVFTDAIEEFIEFLEDNPSPRQFAKKKTLFWKRITTLFPVWGSTLLSLGNMFEDSTYQSTRIIIDEAGQCHPAYGISALLRSGAVLVTGDVNQLTPLFQLSKKDEERIYKKLVPADINIDPEFRVSNESTTSVQMLAQKCDTDILALTDHFRCQKEIIEISDILCDYNLTVHTPKKNITHIVPYLDHPVILIPQNGTQQREGSSWYNNDELETVLRIVNDLLKRDILPGDIGIITPYRAQLYKLEKALKINGFPVERPIELEDTKELKNQTSTKSKNSIAIGTVHRFQGGEREIIIFSSVVTNTKSLQFLNNSVNLLNVTVSRAKTNLITVGDLEILKKGGLTNKLVKRCKIKSVLHNLL
ncbi:MAG: AAA family ATPase [Deltaproteobacteria bacterium]|nr:AAA family ATPase [Deltaproteobacteria bacterium]